MKKIIELRKYEWSLRGFWPQAWEAGYSMETGSKLLPEVGPIPVEVPGSVQSALLKAGLLPDWNLGMNARACEWVENRSWIFQTSIPVKDLGRDSKKFLRFEGLDGNGCVLVNGKKLGNFDNAFIPCHFELDALPEKLSEIRVEIVFEPPPRWLGQICRTSKIKDWKPRFNYTWDWISRIVQIGIWDEVFLEICEEACFEEVICTTSYKTESSLGTVEIAGKICNDSPGRKIKVSITKESNELPIVEYIFEAGDLEKGIRMDGIPVEAWWPNGMGGQHLYHVRVELCDKNNATIDTQLRVVGFRTIEWSPCKNTPKDADPWICVVNGKPVFLQGVNWTPVKPNFADVTTPEYTRLLDIYQDMGCNILRIWGGATLATESFYRACDARGLMIWQEFPLSSSGIDNWPPEDKKIIEEITCIAESYIRRRQHHASLILWCGGNELQGGLDGSKTGDGKPVDDTHPLIKRLKETVNRMDPARRFLPTSSSGPRFYADRKNFGKGLHWDVHGPWGVADEDMEKHRTYWESDDSLFRSEAGAPGSSSANLIMRYAGERANPFPASLENPLWRRTSWWFDWPHFKKEKGREPGSLEEYVEWSQQRQATALAIAARASKNRFPACGGFIVWMGHDSFPCSCNTSIVDFEGNPKPAALALKNIFQDHSEKTE